MPALIRGRPHADPNSVHSDPPKGEAALEAAITECRTLDAKLVVANVARGDSAAERRRLYDEQAEALAKRLAGAGLQYEIKQEIRQGDVAEGLLSLAEELGADRIVIGLRRRSATGKLLFGSVAQQILINAPCPVLSVKPGEN